MRPTNSRSSNPPTPICLHPTSWPRTIAAAALTAGSLHYIPVPPASKTKRYLGLFFNGGGTTPTITVTGWITTATMLQTNKAYPDAFDIT
jgi:hypothetical protein